MKNRSSINYFALISTITLVMLGLAVLVPQSESLQSGLYTVRGANKLNMLEGLGLMFLTYAAAAMTIRAIALRPIQFMKTLWVQIASGFASKLVPAGIGGFALNTRYLVKNKHSVLQASSVMALNGVLGFCGHMLILASGLVFFTESFSKVFEVRLPSRLVLLLGLAAVCILLIALYSLRRKLTKFLRDFRTTLRFYRTKPLVVLAGFIGAMCVTVLFTLALYVSAQSVGVSLSLPEAFIAYTVMSVGAAVTPTPGGMGGAEAALTGILVALGLDTATAFAVALVFRFITFWLPIVPGFICFQILLRNKTL